MRSSSKWRGGRQAGAGVLKALLDLVLGALLDLIVPARCEGCGEAGAVICSRCFVAARGRAAPRPPVPAPPGLPACWSAVPYDGVVKRLIVAYKERGRTALSGPLSASLAEVLVAALTATGASGVIVVPVPSAPRTRRHRGHDTVGALAQRAVREAVRRGHAVTYAPVLRPGRRVADQTGLSAAQRAATVDGALGGTVGLSGAVCVLVDDIVTTGATLAEAARALRAAGARVPLAVTIAATPRRATPSEGRRPPDR